MLRQIGTIAFYTLLEALRNRLMWLLVIVALLSVGLSGFLNALAITESRQIQVALLAAFLRFSGVFLIATFVVTSIVREFNDKGLELILSLPLPRGGYLFGKLAGFAALSLLPALLFGTLISFFSPFEQAALWTLSFLCELWIVAAVSMLCVLTFSQVMTALSATMSFYLMARSVTAFQLIAHAPMNDATVSQRTINFVINAIATVIPRLDEFAQTEWLAYYTGTWSSLPPLLAQGTIFLALVTGAALFDFYRKNI